jgi:hypothetical protein
VLASVIVGGICILTIVIAMTILAARNVPLPAGTAALFGAIVTAFLTGVFATVGHTLGWQNGTTNGEAQAQAEALQVLLGHNDKNP